MIETVFAALIVGILSPLYQYAIQHCVISSIIPEKNGFSICFRYDNNFLQEQDNANSLTQLKKICEQNNLNHHKINSENDTSIMVFPKNKKLIPNETSHCICYQNKHFGDSVNILCEHFKYISVDKNIPL